MAFTPLNLTSQNIRRSQVRYSLVVSNALRRLLGFGLIAQVNSCRFCLLACFESSSDSLRPHSRHYGSARVHNGVFLCRSTANCTLAHLLVNLVPRPVLTEIISRKSHQWSNELQLSGCFKRCRIC